MQTRKGENPLETFSAVVQKRPLVTAGLTPEEREKLYSLGDRLGYLGMDMQLKQLGTAGRGIWNIHFRKLQKELPEKKKLYQKPGNSSGNLCWQYRWQHADNRGRGEDHGGQYYF